MFSIYCNRADCAVSKYEFVALSTVCEITSLHGHVCASCILRNGVAGEQQQACWGESVVAVKGGGGWDLVLKNDNLMELQLHWVLVSSQPIG